MRTCKMHMHMHMHTSCHTHARYSNHPRAYTTQLLVVLLRDLDLLGGDDLLGVATVPLLRLRGLDAPMRFRVPLLHATRLCGEIEGSLVLARA